METTIWLLKLTLVVIAANGVHCMSHVHKWSYGKAMHRTHKSHFKKDEKYCQCDPTCAKVMNNYNIALRGYNLVEGNPHFTGPDPGWRSGIFTGVIYHPPPPGARFGSTAKCELPSGIKIKHTIVCSGEMSEKEITSFKTYHDSMVETTSAGSDLQTPLQSDSIMPGSEYGADSGYGNTGGDSYQNQGYGGETMTPFAVNFGSTDDKSKYFSFFEKEKGAVIKLQATCIKHQVTIMESVPFHANFISRLSKLAEASSEEDRKIKFKDFIIQFGTHYSYRTFLGAQVTSIMSFTESERQNSDRNHAKDCAMNSAAASAQSNSIDFEHNKCKETDPLRKEFRKQAVTRNRFISRGSLPPKNGSLVEWVNQVFVPEPLQMSFTPIPNLFTKQNLKKNMGPKFNFEFVKWFLPLYKNICHVFNYDCKPPEPKCGVTDRCKWSEKCVQKGKTITCVDKNACDYNIGKGFKQNTTLTTIANVTAKTECCWYCKEAHGLCVAFAYYPKFKIGSGKTNNNTKYQCVLFEKAKGLMKNYNVIGGYPTTMMDS